jgi:hypothetical protein
VPVIPAKAGIQGLAAKYDLPELIENLDNPDIFTPWHFYPSARKGIYP